MGTTAFPQNGDGRRKQSVWVGGGDRLIPLSAKVKDSFGSFPSPSPKGQHYVALFPVVPEALIASLRTSPFISSFTLGSSASQTVCRY